MTIKNCYPLPLISKLLNCIKHAHYFTKLDLCKAFHQLRMVLGDEYKIAFRTQYGHYEYLVMPFGLTNASGLMQSYVNDCLQEYLDIFCITFVDDILIYLNSYAKHVQHICKVLLKLQQFGLSCKLSKCQFTVKKISFLGYQISVDGIAMDPKRITAITEWQVPSLVHDVRVFLGFANFYHYFIEGYSHMVTLITSLLKIKGDLKFK